MEHPDFYDRVYEVIWFVASVFSLHLSSLSSALPLPLILYIPLSTFPLSLTTSPSPTIQPQLSNSPPSFSTLLPSYQTGQFFLRFTHFSLTSKCSEERLVLSEGYLAAIERSNYSVGNVSRQKKCLTGLLVVSWILLLLVSAYTWVSILHLTQYLGN